MSTTPIPDYQTTALVRGWQVAAVVFLGVLLAAELVARQFGHVPSVSDDAALWSCERAKLGSRRRPPLTIVGASRSAYGLDLDVLDGEFSGHEVVQLSVRGGGVRPIVAELAEHPPAPGILVVSFAAPTFEDYAEDVSRSMLRAWQAGWRPALGWERYLVGSIQQRLGSLRDELDPREIYESFRLGRGWPDPDARITDLRRSVYAPREWLRAVVTDEEKGHQDGAPLRKRRLERRPTDEQWFERLGALLDDVVALQAAGTQVVFVRMPSWGPVATVEEDIYPRAVYWHALEQGCARVGCSTLHFADEPTLRSFVPPDGSHIAGEERAEFTRRLVQRLRGVADLVGRRS